MKRKNKSDIKLINDIIDEVDTKEIINKAVEIISKDYSSLGSKENPYCISLSKQTLERCLHIKIESNPFYYCGRWTAYCDSPPIVETVRLEEPIKLENDSDAYHRIMSCRNSKINLDANTGRKLTKKEKKIVRKVVDYKGEQS